MKLLSSLLAASALLASGAALADTAQGEFKTTIEITRACQVETNSGTHETPVGADIDFGAYPSSHNQLVRGQSKLNGGLLVKCSQGTPFKVGLQPQSTNSSNGSGNMSFNGNLIAYNLYQDEAHEKPWGNIEGVNTQDKDGKGFGAAANENVMTVYGAVAADQFDKPAGRYNDTVTVTVFY